MTWAKPVVPPLGRLAWLVLGGIAVSAVGSGLTLPFLLVYLTQVRGIELGLAGLILSTVAAAGLLGNPAGGWLVDRIGARRAVVVGLTAAAVGSAAIAVVDDSGQAFAAAAGYGIGMALLWPAEDSLLATVVPDRHRSQVFALRHATLNIGFSVGALTSAWLLAWTSSPAAFALLYLLDAASFLVFAVMVARMSDVPAAECTAPAGRPDGYRAVWRDRAFRRLWLVIVLLVTAGYAQYHSAFPAFATGAGGLSAQGLSLAFAANTVTVVVAQLFVLRMLAGHRRTRGIMLSAAFVAATWLVTLVAADLSTGAISTLLFVTAMVLFGLGETMLSPTVPALVNDLAPAALRGRYNGASTLAWTTGYIVGPAVSALSIDAGHGRTLFLILIAALAAAAIAALRLERHLAPHANRIDGPTAGSPDSPVEVDHVGS